MEGDFTVTAAGAILILLVIAVATVLACVMAIIEMKEKYLDSIEDVKRERPKLPDADTIDPEVFKIVNSILEDGGDNDAESGI